IFIGSRVLVPFGARRLNALVVSISKDLPSNLPKEKIRSIKRIIDKEPIFPNSLLSLSFWMKDYYVSTLGETIFTMLPSAKRESSSVSFSFDSDFSFTKSLSLSEEQKKAISDILTSKKVFHYLYGETGSGKTEVFLQVAQKILDSGKSVIYLVPEISLTAQIIEQVKLRFGDTVATLHSALTPSQKFTEWNRILHGSAKIIIGARSAIFAPVKNLGLIIIDEEHDGSYKSGSNPRYHARQVAMYRASTSGIPLLMGSATPSVESWHLMNTGQLEKHILTKRLAGGSRPKISCIDLTKSKQVSCLSEELTEEIRSTLNQKKQVILFLNRRGFNHFFRCTSCGYEIICKNCSVPMTYHKISHRLKCHYCGWTQVPISFCPQCGSVDIGYSGFGTEYIEAETMAKFPNAKIIRIDSDSLSKKGELDEKLSAFRKGEYDIMLGTQMVAKGLNFPNLQLVGVVLADTGLHMPDFRAGERTFSLITQVAGRAGRFFPDGKVVVQTYSPSKEPVYCACKGNIDAFYESELQVRNLLEFPPFSRLVRLVFRSTVQKTAESSADEATNILFDIAKKNKYSVEILGYSECPIFKISKNYRYQILLKGRRISELQELARTLLFDYNRDQNVYIECDVDPVSLL
ncbi:MAG: primosomal protein N', partial [Treponema sp.]|nr:primosomal protein N' [Treponema sp.]